MATGSRSKSKFSEEDYQRLLANLARGKAAGASAAESAEPAIAAEAPKRGSKAKPAPPEEALMDAAEQASPGSLAAALGVPEERIVSEKKKRQGVKETPIMTAVRECSITIETGPSHIVIVFEGARLFTLNELLAILQYRKYIVFGYKKLWQELVLKALKQMGKNKPHFDGPCNVILFRQGAKMIDRDSFTVMFKYIIDALKDEPRKGVEGIFPDDNPDIVFSDEKRQAIGEPIIGLRVELIDPAPQPQAHRAEELFSDPSIWSSRPKRALPAPDASAVAPKAKRSSQASKGSTSAELPALAPAPENKPVKASAKKRAKSAPAALDPEAPALRPEAKPPKAPAKKRSAKSAPAQGKPVKPPAQA